MSNYVYYMTKYDINTIFIDFDRIVNDKIYLSPFGGTFRFPHTLRSTLGTYKMLLQDVVTICY